jgi:kynurenine formamidase
MNPDTFPFDDVELIDLSIGIEADSPSEPSPPNIEYHDHAAGAERLSNYLREYGTDIEAADFPGGMGLAVETIEAIPHTGTHMDAPWHYGPEVDGEPARRIDNIPLEWCCGRAVVLDFTWKPPESEITPDELDGALEAIDHELSEGELVFLETGADDLWGTPEYKTDFPGMGAAATKHLVEQGAKVIGTDAYGFDKPFRTMGDRFEATGDSEELWPAHFAGRDVEYCQIEKLADLDELPRRIDIPVVTFPVKIEDAGGAWVRPVAFV